MEIKSLIVPKGIDFISNWKEYTLEDYQFPHILNKTITGCGYTEYCITNPLNVILCSPRKILLENKEEQHNETGLNVYYVRNEIEKIDNFEKDFSSKNSPKVIMKELGFSEEEKKERILKLKDGVKDYWNKCNSNPFCQTKPCKILVTYDSFRHVKEALGEDIEKFYVVIDEFQSIFTDAKFKSNAELEFVGQLQGLDKVCYVSATPMLTKYLEMLDEFKHLPYFELDWSKEDPGRLTKPNLDVKYCGKRNTIQAEMKKIISKYLNGAFESYRYIDKDGKLQEIQSKEAVIYVNSVLDIQKAIKYNHLTIDQCNILVSRTTSNEDKIRRAFGGKKSDGITYIGKVPKQGEVHKMFTFCTRTVYLGADFYSTNARTFIFSNANIDCLSVDISLDLPQILGRQRLTENPWKNSANLYITLRYEGEKSRKEYQNYLSKKQTDTNNLLSLYDKGTDEEKLSAAEFHEKVAKAFNYRDNYVAVNRHDGKSLKPVFNNLMLIAEIRTFEIQEYDYVDRVSILSRISTNNIVSESRDRIDATIKNFNYQYTTFIDKMKYLCNQKSVLSEAEYNVVLEQIPMEFRNYIITLGIDKIKSYGYQKSMLNEEFNKLLNQQNLTEDIKKGIYSEFKVGEKDTKANIKERINKIYNQLGYKKTAKALDLEQWFELKLTMFTNRVTGKRDAGFEIIKKKGD